MPKTRFSLVTGAFGTFRLPGPPCINAVVIVTGVLAPDNAPVPENVPVNCETGTAVKDPVTGTQPVFGLSRVYIPRQVSPAERGRVPFTTTWCTVLPPNSTSCSTNVPFAFGVAGCSLVAPPIAPSKVPLVSMHGICSATLPTISPENTSSDMATPGCNNVAGAGFPSWGSGPITSQLPRIVSRLELAGFGGFPPHPQPASQQIPETPTIPATRRSMSHFTACVAATMSTDCHIQKH